MPTPIEKARNLGPVSGRELARAGIHSLQDLCALGWEEAFLRVVELFPERLHLNEACALIGAITDTDWRRIDPAEKERARKLIQRMRAERR